MASGVASAVANKKVKCTLVHALRLCAGRTAPRGSRGIALPFHDQGTRRVWGVSITPQPLFTPGKTRCPLYRRLGGPQVRSGQLRKLSPPPGFDPRTIQPVASGYTDWDTLPKSAMVRSGIPVTVLPIRRHGLQLGNSPSSIFNLGRYCSVGTATWSGDRIL